MHVLFLLGSWRGVVASGSHLFSSCFLCHGWALLALFVGAEFKWRIPIMLLVDGDLVLEADALAWQPTLGPVVLLHDAFGLAIVGRLAHALN